MEFEKVISNALKFENDLYYKKYSDSFSELIEEIIHVLNLPAGMIKPANL